MATLKQNLILFRLLLLLAMFASPSLTSGAGTSNTEIQLPQPQVNLKPEDVVRIVINALAHNNTPFADAGISTTFNFASPSNKISTGPLAKFTDMVKSPGYGLMIDHLSSEFSDVVYKDEMAYQMVRLIAHNSSEIVFAFRLSRQGEGEYQDMWMTDAVWPISSQSSF
jgi:hypothetical protein